MRRFSDPDQMDLLLATASPFEAYVAIEMDKKRHISDMRLSKVVKCSVALDYRTSLEEGGST